MREFASIAELVSALPDRATPVGIVVAAEQRCSTVESLQSLAGQHGRRIVDSASSVAMASPILPADPEGWRDQLVDDLRREQAEASSRVAAARERGGTPEPFDRDVGGWLAAGLCDLLLDRITGDALLQGLCRRLTVDTKSRAAETDFLRPEGIRFLEAGRSAQSMLTKLSLASTNQFRAAAARLINHLLDRRSESGNVEPVIIVGEDETVVRQRAGASAVLFRLIEPLVPTVSTAAADELNQLRDDLRRIEAQAELFRRHGIAVGNVDTAIASEIDAFSNASSLNGQETRRLIEKSQAVRSACERAILEAWHHWFADQLASVDAEWFLQQDPDWDFLDVPRLMDDVRAILLQDGVSGKLPASEEEFVNVERFIAAFRELDQKWRTHLWTPVEEGMAFDAAVAAGGAPLGMLTSGVRWWLKKENRDWRKYRIVRVD